MVKPLVGRRQASSVLSESSSQRVRSGQELLERAKDRIWLRQTAMAMRDSGTLRIKEHYKGFGAMGVFKESWKGEYAVEWMINSKTVADPNEAVWLGNQMLAAGLLHHVNHSIPFKASADLYQFLLPDAAAEDRRNKDGLQLQSNLNLSKDFSANKEGAAAVTALRRRCGDLEMRLENVEAQQALSRAARLYTLQLEWRVGIIERRCQLGETLFRSAVAVQQLAAVVVVVGCAWRWLEGLFVWASGTGTFVCGVLAVLGSALVVQGWHILKAHQAMKVDYSQISDAVDACLKKVDQPVVSARREPTEDFSSHTFTDMSVGDPSINLSTLGSLPLSEGTSLKGSCNLRNPRPNGIRNTISTFSNNVCSQFSRRTNASTPGTLTSTKTDFMAPEPLELSPPGTILAQQPTPGSPQSTEKRSALCARPRAPPVRGTPHMLTPMPELPSIEDQVNANSSATVDPLASNPQAPIHSRYSPEDQPWTYLGPTVDNAQSPFMADSNTGVWAARKRRSASIDATIPIDKPDEIRSRGSEAMRQSGCYPAIDFETAKSSPDVPKLRAPTRSTGLRASNSSVIPFALSEMKLPDVEAMHIPSEEAYTGWANDPIMLRMTGRPGHKMVTELDPMARMKVNHGDEYEFDTPSFSGKIAMFIRGVEGDPQFDYMFEGKRRMTWAIVQGRFKQPIGMNSLLTGQEFARPAQNLPAKWFINNVLISVAKSLAPSARFGSPSQSPTILFPLVAMAQSINVAIPGSEPNMLDKPKEDMRLLNSSLVNKMGEPMSFDKRKTFYNSEQHRKDGVFKTEYVYTFHMWQHAVNIATYNLQVVRNYNLIRHLDGQPLRVMVKNEEDESHPWDFSLWHRDLLPNAHRAAEIEYTLSPTRSAPIYTSDDNMSSFSRSANHVRDPERQTYSETQSPYHPQSQHAHSDAPDAFPCHDSSMFGAGSVNTSFSMEGSEYPDSVSDTHLRTPMKVHYDSDSEAARLRTPDRGRPLFDGVFGSKERPSSLHRRKTSSLTAEALAEAEKLQQSQKDPSQGGRRETNASDDCYLASPPRFRDDTGDTSLYVSRSRQQLDSQFVASSVTSRDRSIQSRTNADESPRMASPLRPRASPFKGRVGPDGPSSPPVILDKQCDTSKAESGHDSDSCSAGESQSSSLTAGKGDTSVGESPAGYGKRFTKNIKRLARGGKLKISTKSKRDDPFPY